MSEPRRHPLPGGEDAHQSHDAPEQPQPESQPQDQPEARPQAQLPSQAAANGVHDVEFFATGEGPAGSVGPALSSPNGQPPQPFTLPPPPGFAYGYPPQQYTPYGTPLFAYPPPRQPQTNGIALAGLLTAIFVWPAGLVLSAIGLRKSRQLGGAGRGQAIAGLVIAPISAAITVLVAIGLIAAATAIGDGGSAMFGDATNDPGCNMILASLSDVPGELQAAAAGPQAAITYLNGLDQSVQSAENAAVNVEVSDDLNKLDGDIGTVTEDLQAIIGGGTIQSTGVNVDIAELDTDSGALQSLCTGAT